MLDRVDRLQSKVEDSALSLWSSTNRLRRLVSDGFEVSSLMACFSIVWFCRPRDRSCSRVNKRWSELDG